MSDFLRRLSEAAIYKTVGIEMEFSVVRRDDLKDLIAENESLRMSIEYQKCYIESLRADLRESYAIISSPENH